MSTNMTEEERLAEIERKYPGGTKFRTEEPLKGYREYVFTRLAEKFLYDSHYER